MRIKNIYLCDYCDKQFEDIKSAEQHEAGHYGLSYSDYTEWKTYHKAAAIAGAHVGISKNPQTDAAFTKAIQDLVDFEDSHNLDGNCCPNNWRRM